MAVYKVNISIPEHLVAEIDETASELGMSRSAFVAEASARYLADVRHLSAEELRRKDIIRAREIFAEIGRELPPGFDFVELLRRERDKKAGESR